MNAYSLPPHVLLHELRRDAKRLLEAALDGDVPCLERFYEIGKEPSLTAAQLLVARDHGFSSWAKLKQQAERNAADPRTEVLRQLIRRRGRSPEPELAAVVPYEQVVPAASDAKVVVSSVRVHSDRCVIDLESEPLSSNDVDGLRVTGVRFADGRSSGHDWVAEMMANPGVEVPLLQWSEGFGGYRVSVRPLPPPGDLHLTIAWPGAGIPDGTSVALDTTPIRAAVGKVRPFTLGSAADDAPPGSIEEAVGTPDAPPRGPRPLFGDPSEDAISAIVPVSKVVARSSRLAVAVHAIRVHRAWCMLEVEWITPWTTDRCSPYVMAIPQMFRRSGPYVDGRILTPRFGFVFSDGRSPAVRSREGGDPGLPRGRYSRGQTELRLAPLPPPGEVRFWLAWPDLGVAETTTILDGTGILQAAQRLQ
ncbi:hypothetical protein [Flindersiella endophytica]